MAILKKTSFKQNLEQISVFINDFDPNSQYFRVTDLPDTFTGGKNAFLVQGSTNLVPDTLVKIEIKDSLGNVIYSEPSAGIPSYYEGTSKVVSVHVYPDTAFGPCTITILGELSSYTVDGINVPVPLDWVGKYNVKWQRTINVNPFKKNITPIRFYRRPQVEITESVLPIYNRNVTSVTLSGSINGTSILPIQDTDYRTYRGPISYELSTTSSFFSQSMEGFNINVSELSSSYSPLLTDVINDKKALVSIPYYITGSTPDPFYERIRNFSNKPFSITYDESVSITNSNINSSFAKIRITDLETFTGDASRIKVYASSKNDLGDYQLLEDALLESNEILQVDEFNGVLNVRTGIFSQPVIDSYWQTENITTSPIVSIDNSLLIRSVKLQPTTDVNSPVNLQGLFKFMTSGSINFSRFTQYQLDFTPLMSSSLGNYALLEIYGSGSAFVNSNSSNTFGKFLGELETNTPFRRYDRQTINFQPDANGDGKLVFLVKAGTWHISNVSLKAAQESSFSPNEISLVVNVPTKINNETFDFKFEIYDINNNYVPITLQTSSLFVGGNDVSVTRNLELNLSNNSFNFSTSSVIPSFITIDFTKSGLTGSVLFASSAVDTTGNEISPQAGFPGTLEVVDENTYKLTAANFTGSISGVTVGAISYTASCEDINRYFTVFRTEQGAPAYLFYATADKNNFTFNPDAGYKSVVQNDYIDIRLVQQNLPDNGPMGLVINSASEAGSPPPLYYTSSVGNASIYRLFVSTSSDITPDNKNGYTFAIGQSNYDFELHTIDGVFTSSITIDAIPKGDAAKGIIATSDKNQFFYKMSNADPDPNPQSATIFVKRLNLTSPSSSITVNSGSGKPALTLISNNIGNGVAQYGISTTEYPYSAGSTTYYFTGSDSNDIEYIDEVTLDALIVKSQIGVLASNENTTLTAYSTGFVPSASFLSTTGSIIVTVGNETASYAPTLTTNRFSASISQSTGVSNPTIVDGVYSIGQLTNDTGSVTLNVSYQDATGVITNFPKIITYSKAKKAAPVLAINITNNNQTVNAKSTGVQLSEFASASIEILETYDGVTTAKSIYGTPTITTLYGYSNYFYNSVNQTIALRTLSTDFEQLSISLEVLDSENVIRVLDGNISLAKARNAVPNVEVSLVPVAQTILANSRGSGSVTPQPITVTAAEGGTDRFTSIGTLSFTNGLAGTATGNTINFSSNATSMLRDSGSIFIPINYTDGEGNTGLKTIVASVTRVRSAAPLTAISVTPQTQTVTSSSIGYATPQNVTLTLQEVGGTPYAYTSTLGSTINTFSASVTNATINTSTGIITPNTPNTSLGVNASSLITYINSEGTILTSSVSYSVGVALEGNDGGQGPGVVYRGTYVAGTAYFHTDIRRDIVVYSGQYYLANNTAKSGLTTWGTPPTDWTAFGATFDAVATNVLLTADATITRGLVMGTLDGFSGFIRSANATSLTAGKGYYFNYDGTFRFGDTGSSVVSWDGTNLTVSGTIKAQTGSIGGITMSANSIYTGTGTYANNNTGFFLSSSGHFSLEDKLSWDPVNNYLNVSGTITATTGSIGGITMSNAAVYAGAGLWNDKNTGFFISRSGHFSLEDKLSWDPTNNYLNISGTIKADTGSIGGVTMSANSIFAGVGNYNNKNTGFFLSSSGHFSLEDKLSWNPIGEYLNISGTIRAVTGSIGGITMSNAAVYAGAGLWNDKNTGFFISSSGHFSLEDKFIWDPVGEYLNISGTIRAQTGSIGGWTIDSSSIFSGTKRDETYNQFNSASMITIGSSGYISAPGFYISTTGRGVFSGSLQANGGTVLTTTNLLLFTASMHSFTSSVSSSLINISSSISLSIAILDDTIFTNSNGLIDKLPNASTSGLYTGKEYLGYFKAGSGWTSFLSASGDFYLSGSGTQGLVWNSTANTLSIDGRVVARTGLIGGWGIGTSEISSSGTTGGGDASLTSAGMRIGGTGYISAKNFYISSAGNVVLSGSIAANAGFIGGWVIAGSSISTANAVGGSDGVGTTSGVILSKDGWISTKNFTVSSGGNVSLTGTITATDGAIGSWLIDSDSIYVGTKRSSTYNQFNSSSMITIGSAGYISAPGFFITTTGQSSFSGSLRANGGQLITTTGLLQFTQSISQSLIDISASISVSVATLDTAIFTNSNGLIDKLPNPGTTTGLYTGKEYLGYFKNGSGWTSFLSSSGEFYLSGSSTTGLVWIPQTNTLSIDGRVVARDGLVGGWKIGLTDISSSNASGGSNGAFTTSGIVINSTGWISAPNFVISQAGNVEVRGTIRASAGDIGGWTINTNNISSAGTSGGGDGSFTNSGIILNKDGWISSEKFFISSSGDVSFAGKLAYGARGSGVNIMPLVWKYDPKDVNGLAATSYENIRTLNGTIYDNAINYGTDPFGKQSLLWECYPSGDGNADGGWESNITEIDNNKTYKFITYAKINNNADGDLYFGFYSFDANNTLVSSSYLNDTVTNNSYFFFSQNPSGVNPIPFTNRWYLMVGYVHGRDYTGTTNMGGVYDVESGRKVFECYDFKWKTDGVNPILKSLHRCYHFYNTVGNGTTLYQQMFGPAVFEVDGTEPDLNRLLDKAQSISNGSSSGSFMNGTTFYSPVISGSRGDFTGKITAGEGLIGGWLIDNNRLYSSGSGSNNIIKMKLEPNFAAPQFTLSDDSGNPAVVIKTGDLIDPTQGTTSISLTWNADKAGFSGYEQYGASTSTKYNNYSSFTVAANQSGLYIGTISTSGINGLISSMNPNFAGYLYAGVGYQIATDTAFTNIISEDIVSSFSRGTQGALDLAAGGKDVEVTLVASVTYYFRSYWSRIVAGVNTDMTWASVNHNFPNFSLEKSVAYTQLTDYGFQLIRSTTRYVTMQRVGSTNVMVQVGGEITATSNITAYSSDKRLKTNVNILQNSLEKLNKLSGFTYNWNDKANELAGYDTNESIVGMFAQDVQEVLPEAVKIAPFDNDGEGNSKSGENYLTIQYEKVVPLLVEAIKELKKEIEELKKNK